MPTTRIAILGPVAFGGGPLPAIALNTACRCEAPAIGSVITVPRPTP
jgi:hypothetical protein